MHQLKSLSHLTPRVLAPFPWRGLGRPRAEPRGGKTTDRSLCPRSPLIALPPQAAFSRPERKKERGAEWVPARGLREAMDWGPREEEGQPAAPRLLGLLRAPNLTECGSRWGVQRSLRPAPPGAPRARGGAAAREPSRRPRSSGRSPRRGRGAAARVLPAPAARGGAGPAGHQLLEEAEREREEPGGGRGGGRAPPGSRGRRREPAHRAPAAMAG